MERKWTLFHTNDGAVASYTDYQKTGLRNGSVLVQDQWEIPHLKDGHRHPVFSLLQTFLVLALSRSCCCA